MIAQTTTCGYTGSLSKNLAVIPPRQSAAFFMPACRQSYPSLVGVENSHTTPARGKLCAAPKLPRVRPTARIEGGLSLKNLEVSMTVLAFRDVTFDVRTIRNTTYITSTQLAQALGYSREDAVGRIYERNADEFTSDMSQTVKLTVSGNYQKTVRLFSLRGAHLVAMFARTPVAKEFRKWVLDVLDKETHKTNNQRVSRVAYNGLIPAEQAREIMIRLNRVGKIFHPFSDQFCDLNGIARLLRGLHPNLGVQDKRYVKIIDNPEVRHD